MSIMIAVPQDQFAAWCERPYSEMQAAVEAGELHDARKLDREKWDAIPDKDPAEKYSFLTLDHSDTGKRLKGYAIFREGGRDFTRPDVAALMWQGF